MPSCTTLPIITEANLAAAISNELENPYQMDPTESGDPLRLSASCALNKTAPEDDDVYMVMAGRRRSVLSPGPLPVVDNIAAKEDNKAYAIYAEIGENAKIDLQ